MTSYHFIYKYLSGRLPCNTKLGNLSVRNDVLYSYDFPIADVRRSTKRAYVRRYDTDTTMTTKRHIHLVFSAYEVAMGLHMWAVPYLPDDYTTTDEFVRDNVEFWIEQLSSQLEVVNSTRRRYATRISAAKEYADTVELINKFLVDQGREPLRFIFPDAVTEYLVLAKLENAA